MNDYEKLAELERAKHQMTEIIDSELKGILLRSRAEYIEGAEKNTKYFANVEKKRAEQKVIRTLNTDSDTLNNNQDILDYTMQYYAKLYSNDNTTDDDNYFFNLEHNKLNDHENIRLSGHITEGECLDAIQNMNHNKSPGSDGLSVEFYKTFWTDIKSFYTKSINYSYDNGSLTELQNQSVITLIPKKKMIHV